MYSAICLHRLADGYKLKVIAIKNKFRIQQAIVVLLVVIFAYPGTNKLMEMGNFKEQLSQSLFISIGLAGLLSWLVPLLLLSIWSCYL